MPRSPRTLLFLALACLLAACDTPDSDAPADATPAVARTTEASTPPPPSVALDLHDDATLDDLTSALATAGYVVSPDAPTRVTDTAPTASDTASDTPTGSAVLEVRLASYALVVHPRAPIVDLDRAQAIAIVGMEDGAGLGGPLVGSAGLPGWASASPPANRFVETATPAEVMDYVLADPTAIGIVPVEALEPRVRALTWHLFDPYRDPPEENPLADMRWIVGPDAEAVATALGWDADGTNPASLLATGELIPARCVSDRVASLDGGYDASYDGTRALIEAADLAMAHWEPAIIDGVPTPCTPTFNLSTRPAAAEAAQRAGIDVALAVGNHVGDCWPGCGYQAAVQETVRHLEAAKLLTVGAGEDIEAARQPGIIERDGVTFAFLGYDDIAFQHYGATATTPGTAHADLEGIANDVRAAKERADHVIVGFSWGVEYVTAPTQRQQDFARAAAEAGASIVVGNHPHWVQATEWIGNTFVVYGLGNFVFDQDWSVETTQGAILEAGFTPNRLLGVRLRPTAIRQQYAVELLDPTQGEGATILQRIWIATDTLEASGR